MVVVVVVEEREDIAGQVGNRWHWVI